MPRLLSPVEQYVKNVNEYQQNKHDKRPGWEEMEEFESTMICSLSIKATDRYGW
jgi:hypothetical protein